jgi:predicted secreted protein with PEFG-CTERM motif
LNQIGNIFDSGTIAPGKTYSFTFQDAGTYKYSDKVDKWMVGEVIVRPSNQPSPAVPEFGTLAGMIIVISMICVVIISRKFRFHI